MSVVNKGVIGGRVRSKEMNQLVLREACNPTKTRYPSKVTTGGQAITLQENSTRGNDVGCGRQRPPRPSTSS